MGTPNIPKALTDLDAATPLTTDLLYLIDDPAGTPISKKVEFGDASNGLLWKDSVKLRLGTGLDVEIYFDGTDLHIVPDAVGSGVIKMGSHVDLIDSDKIRFGTGVDAAIYYDGTDLQIDPKVVGSGHVTIKGICKAEGVSSECFRAENATDPFYSWFEGSTRRSYMQYQTTNHILVIAAEESGSVIKMYSAGVLGLTLDASQDLSIVGAVSGGSTIEATAGFKDNGVSGIDKSFNFLDGDLNTHTIVFGGGLLTAWNIA